ncbi:MAG: glutathione S-transferase family protein [Acidobacteriota bacterium]
MSLLLYSFLGLVAVGLLWFAVEKRRRRIRPITGGIDRSTTLPHTEAVELYSNSFSHCSRKVRLVLAELGIEAKHHSIDLIETGWYQTISAEYLKVNPSGLVPTLVHQGHPVFESDDILTYAQSIADADAPQLVPADERREAEMQEWLHFCAIVSADLMGGMKERAGACIPGLTMPLFITSIRYIPLRRILVGFLFHHTVKSPTLFFTFKVLGLRRMMRVSKLRELVHASRDAMRTHLETIDRSLAEHGKPWILGESYSLADVSISCMLLRLEETGWLRWFHASASLPHLSAYYDRLKARSAWKEAIEAHAHPIVTQARNDLEQIVETDPELAEVVYGPLTRSEAPGLDVPQQSAATASS